MKDMIVGISTQSIKLDSFLKLTGRVSSGGQAKELIRQGKIFVNGEMCLQRGRKLFDGDTVCIETENAAYRVQGKTPP